MKVPSRTLLVLLAFFLAATGLSAPPPLPLPVSAGASRGAMLRAPHWIRSRAVGPTAGNTVLLPLSAGLTLISIPVHTQSTVLSDMLQNLPTGSRVWIWNASTQQFVEGFDQELPLGQGAVLYVPAPTVVMVTGDDDSSTEIPVDLQNGWNLIGVPYATPLSRSAQYVYVASIRTALNDAVNHGDLGQSIFSLDVRGQQVVGEDESFQPMNAYWVYSQNADLLELQPLRALRGSAETEFAIWAVKAVGGAGLNFAAGQLFRLINGDPNQGLIDQLKGISDAIEDIKATQQSMLDQQKAAAQTIQLDIAKINTTVEQQALLDVDVHLSTYLRNPTFKDSLEWFIQNQTKNVDQLKAAGALDDRTQFSYRVIRQYGMLNDFNAVANRVQGINGTSILDNFINNIVISNATNTTLEDRYRAMESYFTWTIGLQVECATLITNAYEQLESSPQYGKEFAGAAADFRNNIYFPALQKEAAKFQSLVETIVARELALPTNADQAPVAVSRSVQELILPRMDFMLMNLVGQPPGLRARILASPDMNSTNTYVIQWGSTDRAQLRSAAVLASTTTACGSALAQDCWRPFVGPKLYDSWRRYPANLAWSEFFVTKNWNLLQTAVPAQPGTRTLIDVKDSFRVLDWRRDYGYQVIDFQKMGVDSSGNLVPSQNGVLFGSVILTKRASADSMLQIPGSDRPTVTHNYDCKLPVVFNTPSRNNVSIRTCGNGSADISNSALFLYCATCTAGFSGALTYGVSLSVTGDRGGSYAWSALKCSNFASPAGVSVTNHSPGTAQSIMFPVTFQPGQLCSVEIGAYWTPFAGRFPSAIAAQRGPLFMSVP